MEDFKNEQSLRGLGANSKWSNIHVFGVQKEKRQKDDAGIEVKQKLKE